MKSFLTVVGARPQFVKAAAVSKAVAEYNENSSQTLDEILLHTGQHFDANMSDLFFNQMRIPQPDIQLDIHGGTHAEMTGRMLVEIEKVILQAEPECVVVYGDTNSTLAGALAASKLHVPIAHIEAGLRSFNMEMPEEVNRILTDRISSFLFCPTDTAIENLNNEGFENIEAQIFKPGDVMQDAALLFAEESKKPGFDVPDQFVLATWHRAENTDHPERMDQIVKAINRISKEIAPVILPLHPRTKQALARSGVTLDATIVSPVGYLEMIWILQHCGLVLTDSGGLQKEAFFFNKPCVTMRNETEWVELVTCGANVIVGVDADKMVSEVQQRFGTAVRDESNLYGGGTAAKTIIDVLAKAD